MFTRVCRSLERLFAASQKHSCQRITTARAPRRAHPALEPLEDRLALSHAWMVFPPAGPAANAVARHHEETAVSAHEQFTNHLSPGNEAARLALFKQMNQSALLKEANHHVPPGKPVFAPPVSISPPPQHHTSPAPAPVEPPHIEPFPLPPVIVNPMPHPGPSPIQPGLPGNAPGINPATYIPEYCTTASFSGNVGADGHYSSFTIVGHNTGTGTTVIISYSTGTPYGSPVYHWAVIVDSQLLGNWGNQCTVNQPYYGDFLPQPVSYHQPGYGPE